MTPEDYLHILQKLLAGESFSYVSDIDESEFIEVYFELKKSTF